MKFLGKQGNFRPKSVTNFFHVSRFYGKSLSIPPHPPYPTPTPNSNEVININAHFFRKIQKDHHFRHFRGHLGRWGINKIGH